MSIPGSICCPNAEIPYKASSLVKDAKTEIIVNSLIHYQMLIMILQQGFEHIFSQWSENPSPYFGWPEEWQSIQKNLDEEFKKVMEVN